ncbi:RING-H2 finger protein ATL46-like [Nicotiana tabacum]|uniref:RING-type E3 ubiquitin transferase n=1 Tax=Nicotiana tabacum TaxID=4097 RepID=A0A1S3Y8G5_TOBAC|nr:RING-H2 finger protein ATL46-like [Nicotiana tomentosiformis]XP_016448420.1 PREDICTED: RING-H2 finger protein ATL46-like [Nicotiana tabacum]
MSSSSSGNKISPAVLFIIVILAIIFFISGILHLLVRYLMKHRFSSQSARDPEMSDSGSYQRQLQQLFNLHDSGLDQSFIDALPVFLYKDIMGLKEPFDCAVCLCEFSEQDKLRLLPLCSHAFHISCIDTWLLSNSTCPLCRGSLFTPGFCIENPIFYFDDTTRDECCGGGVSENGSVIVGPKLHEDIDSKISSRRVFSVRLGKFKNTNNGILEIEKREMGETSNSNLDSRRCFSMGSFQYVVADSELQVALCPNSAKSNGVDGGGHQLRGNVKGKSGQNGNSANDGDNYGKRINLGNRGESFSVSKIWLWSKKDKFHNSADNVSLPWTDHHRAPPV